MTATRAKATAIGLEFEPLDLTTTHPFGISYGTSSDTHNVLVRLKYEDFTGLGEAAPASYHGETRQTVLAVLSSWKDTEILGNCPFAISQVTDRLDKFVAGHNSAKAAIEMALHDLAGKICGQPVRNMLGLSQMPVPMTDFTIGIDSLDMVEKKTREAVDAGYKMLKVKQGTDYDKEIIKTIRKVAPSIPLRVDANGAWKPKRAIEMSRFLKEHNVEFIEQPLPKNASVDDFRHVRQAAAIPIYADESVCRSNDVARLSGAVDGVVVKLAKTGGLLEAIKVIHTARAHGMKVMIGCMIESSIGVTAAFHLAGLVDHLDLDGAMLLKNDPFDGASYDDGYLHLRDLPGLGVSERKQAK
ncbi:MAG: dipeptide epimerase [Candidatus Obscuribacterales bacterium]|nr:dipeptide epimerase [Candidatus Obscuribacterales bacterium]